MSKDNLVRIAWHIDSRGHARMARVTEKSRKIEPNSWLSGAARRTERELKKRLDDAGMLKQA